MRPFSIIVAFDAKYGIGKNGRLAWDLPSDLKYFKEITTRVSHPSKKNAVIMGRKTWDSLPPKYRPLPGRVNVVLSHSAVLDLPAGVHAAQSLEQAIALLPAAEIEDIFVIGGSQIFSLALAHPSCLRLYVTHVQGDFACDVFFPAISLQFMLISASENLMENGTSYQFSIYMRQ